MYLAEKTGWANGRVLRKRPDLRRGRNCCFPYRHTGRRIVVLKQATVHADLVNMCYNPGVDSLTPPSKRLEPHQTSRRTPSGPARRRTVSQRSPWRIGTLFVRKRAIEALSRTAFFLTNRTSAFTENQLALRRRPGRGGWHPQEQVRQQALVRRGTFRRNSVRRHTVCCAHSYCGSRNLLKS